MFWQLYVQKTLCIYEDEVFGGVFSGSFMKAFNFTNFSNGSADGPARHHGDWHMS